ncbi:hypothetical protein IWW38_003690, partial [Coemansia aciculifera]
HAPGFPLSSTLDGLLRMVPHLSDQEAHLVSGLLCSTVLSTAAHFQARKYAQAERSALALAQRKKHDDVESDDDLEEKEDDDNEEEEDSE